MANLKEVRERIRSVISTQQITKAMKMVSAAKLRKAQQAITRMRPYDQKLTGVLQNLLEALEGDLNSPLAIQREIKNPMIVVVTSSKGLCGAFNTNICKAAAAKIDAKYKRFYEEGTLQILCVGKKGAEYFSRSYPKEIIQKDYLYLFSDLSFENVNILGNLLIEMFENGTVDHIDVAYGRFKNAVMQFAELKQFAPIVAPKTSAQKEMSRVKTDYIFEPNKQDLLEDLVPMIMKTQFYRFLLDTHASEHGARMTAMENATENAKELLKDLKVSYNKARQEAITSEISEIVGGAAALEGA